MGLSTKYQSIIDFLRANQDRLGDLKGVTIIINIGENSKVTGEITKKLTPITVKEENV